MKPINLNRFIVVLVALTSISALANQYDGEEKLRRFLQDADKHEQQERDKARDRYDKAHETNSSNGGAEGVLGTFALIAFGVGLAIYSKVKNG